MKVFMFGREFPPSTSGGLGSASFRLFKGLSKLIDMNGSVEFAKIFWGENKSNIKLIGVSDGYVRNRNDYLKEFGPSVEFNQVSSKCEPYVDAVEYSQQTGCSIVGSKSLIEVEHQGNGLFKGKHRPDLLSEINRLKWEYLARGCINIYRSVN